MWSVASYMTVATNNNQPTEMMVYKHINHRHSKPSAFCLKPTIVNKLEQITNQINVPNP